MKNHFTSVVVTTIQGPTPCMHELAKPVEKFQLHWYVIGDRKGPFFYDLPPAELISIDDQRDLPFRLAKLLPEGHYTRKNLGYLLAMRSGSSCIYETDDDNGPLPDWKLRSVEVQGRRILPKDKASWVNMYAAYSDAHIWPRGLPLENIRDPFLELFDFSNESISRKAPIQQGLANGSPDVDAIWRLVLDKEITFRRDVGNLFIPKHTWSPFNSQNTWWWPEAYLLMYLPSYCSFRMTDIWRSFVAQRCLWTLGYELEFHPADMYQIRNQHHLLTDFSQELEGYLRNDHIRQALEALNLQDGVEHLEENLRACYRAMVDLSVIKDEELPLLEAWIADCSDLKNASAN